MVKDTIDITVNGVTKTYERGISYEKIAKDFANQYEGMIVLAKVNNKLCELHKMPSKDCNVSFLTTSSKPGYMTYLRSCIFLLNKSLRDVLGSKLQKAKVEFSIGKGLYCSLYGDFEVNEQLLRSVKARMDDIVESNIPIWKNSMTVDDAIEMFGALNMNDKVKLLKYRRASKVNIYAIGNYKNYYYGYMVPSTGYLKLYDIALFDEGIVLIHPTRENPEVLPEFIPSMMLFNTLKANTKWGERLGVETVGDLNNIVCEGRFSDFIMIQEAKMEGDISQIAAQIASKDNVKFVMIAGPSSSGKTTFSYRLSIQLKAQGFNPHTIALDDYYKNKADCPKDENGEFDFECLDALDVEGFNSDMKRLLAGEEVELPSYNFKTGKREYKGNLVKLNKGDILVIEGIHGLNEKMSYALPRESKFTIYISALTSLNIDEHNRIPTTEIRLIRRIVRDYKTRGTSAGKTMAMWDSVRRGEEKYIFPFQGEADAMFNSTLVYELNVLKQFAEPLLFGIPKDDPEYYEAKRLLKFLDYFLGVTSEDIPNNSILREFVGGSVFRV